MNNKPLFSTLLIGLLSSFVHGQAIESNHLFQLSGTIRDASNKTLLPAASVSVKGTSNGVLSDKNGKYAITLNGGSIHLYCQYLGYVPIDTLVNITANRQLNLYLVPGPQMLKQVIISDKVAPHKEIATQNMAVLQGDELERTRGLSLGDALKSVTGVTTFQTGPSIAKPVIHGLTGARVLF